MTALEIALECARPLFKAKAVVPARRFTNDSGQLVYSKVTTQMIDIQPSEAECFLVHAFAVVDADKVRAILEAGDA